MKPAAPIITRIRQMKQHIRRQAVQHYHATGYIPADSIRALNQLTHLEKGGCLHRTVKYNDAQPRVPVGYRAGGRWNRIGDGYGPASAESTRRLRRQFGLSPVGKPPRPLQRPERVRAVRVSYDPDVSGINDPPLESVYPVENALMGAVGAYRAAAYAIDRALRNSIASRLFLGNHKGPLSWANKMARGEWNMPQIRHVVIIGKRFRAPNKLDPSVKAWRFEDPKLDRYVTIDENGKVLHTSGFGFKRPPIPKKSLVCHSDLKYYGSRKSK